MYYRTHGERAPAAHPIIAHNSLENYFGHEQQQQRQLVDTSELASIAYRPARRPTTPSVQSAPNVTIVTYVYVAST